MNIKERFSVIVGDGEVNDYLLSEYEAITLAEEYRTKGYDDVVILDTITNKILS